MTLVVLGDLMVDVVTRMSGPLARGSDTPAQVSVEGGGSAANVAAWAASLGSPVALVCRVGDDERGRAAVAGLRAGGVDVHATLDPDRQTGTCVVLVEPGGERTMLPDPGANDAPLGPVPARRPPARRRLRAAARRARARARWRRSSTREQPGRRSRSTRRRGRSCTPGAIPGGRPAAAERGGGGGTGEQSAHETVVKLGPAGARWSDGSQAIHVPAELGTVVDTTGAGDAFAAGLLVARLGGAGPRAALEAGCRMAARAVAQVGARPS